MDWVEDGSATQVFLKTYFLFPLHLIFNDFFPDCAILNQEIVLHNIALTKVDAILDKIDHIGTDLAPPDVKMFLSNTRVRFSVIR